MQIRRTHDVTQMRLFPGGGMWFAMLVVACLGSLRLFANELTQKRGEVKIRVRGQVVGLQDQPVAGADVFVVAIGGRLAAATKSDASGGFEIEFSQDAVKSPPGYKDWRHASLVATHEGYGPGWNRLGELEGNPEPVLRLVEDADVEGHVLDLQGRPIHGATVRLISVYGNDEQNLDGFLKATRDEPTRMWSYATNSMRYLSDQALSPLTGVTVGEELDELVVTTDEEGRFTLSGIGLERVARFHLSGPEIESTLFGVVTRPEIDPKWKRGRPDEESQVMRDIGVPIEMVYPAKFFHFAGPSRPITGVVRDQATGKPLAGVGVSGSIEGLANSASDETDEKGRYELTGLATEGTLRLYAVPADEMPYLSAQRMDVKITAASDPNDQDTNFELVRGVLVKGRLVDAISGQPVDGWIEYFPFADNRFVEELPSGLSPYTRIYSQEGRFQITVLPGPGFLGAKANDDGYISAKEEDFGRPFTSQINAGFWTANRGLVRPDEFHVVGPIDPKSNSEPITLDLRFRSGNAVIGQLVDPAGRSVKGVHAKGLSPVSFSDELQGDEFTVTGIEGGENRRVIFRHEEHRMGAVATFSGEVAEPVTVILRPFATLTGRIVDEDGHPIPGAYLGVGSEGTAQWAYTYRQKRIRPEGPQPFELSEDNESGRTDADGRFRLTGILPGVRGELLAAPPKVANGSYTPPSSAPAATFTLRAGETRDLGDVTLPQDAANGAQEVDR